MNGYWWSTNSSNSKGIRWLSWDNMTMARNEGGLGFRNLHGFNLALLGKHCWNFINNPTSLVSRVFKARYFPNSNFFQARREGGASFIWSGIWTAKEELKEGFRWVIGNGMTVEMFRDRWLRNKSDFRVDIDHNTGLREEKVCEFFSPGVKMWDVDKIQSTFSATDASAILATRIPQTQAVDRLAWLHSTDGIYTVKTGYKFWQSQRRSSVPHSFQTGWSKIWRVSVPHKVRILLWRFCRNNLPVRNILRSKGVATTIVCPMCDNDVEHLLHVFFDCNFASQCWLRSGLQYDMSLVDSAPVWLLERLSSEAHEVIIKIASVIGAIWFARNKKIWEGKVMTPEIAMEWSNKQIKEWREVQQKKLKVNSSQASHVTEIRHRWKAPPTGILKMNVDASVFEGSPSFSLGLVLRDDRGAFIKGRTVCVNGVASVFEAETRGVLEALTWAAEEIHQAVIIETDSMLTTTALTKKGDNYLEVGNILRECCDLLSLRSDISVTFVRKQANRAAHRLARFRVSPDSYNDFMSPPSSLLETLMYDSLSC